jgi:sulfur relay (sulfurtransferase) complex TusBCD TusD component (DsrE family)
MGMLALRLRLKSVGSQGRKILFQESAVAAHPKNYLLIVNDAPYGNERPFNALRLALNLVKRPEASVRVFLMGDGVNCAVRGQKTPDGYYNVERMLQSVARRGAVAT